MTDDTFDWGSLGPEKWKEFQEITQASDLQVRFAVARHGGATATAAAKIAGYAGDHEAIRRAGYSALRSTAVVALLDLATVENPIEATLVTDSEVDARLSRLVRSTDPMVMLKATELFDKRKQRSGISGSIDTGKMALAEHLLVSILLCTREGTYPPELFIANWALIAIPEQAWWCPLLRQMAPYLKVHHPAVWSIARRHLYEWRPADLQAIESGPVLSAAEIFEIAAKHAGLLLTVIDESSDPDARKNAYDEMRKVGLVEPEGKRTATIHAFKPVTP